MKVVVQMDWAAVRSRLFEGEEEPTFDVWRWNVFEQKWTRMSNTAGMGKLVDAKRAAKKLNDEIAAMLEANRQPPQAMKVVANRLL